MFLKNEGYSNSSKILEISIYIFVKEKIKNYFSFISI